MILYTGATGEQLHMGMAGISRTLASHSRAVMQAAKELIAKRARVVGASKVCHYHRGPNVLEVVNGTGELNDRYYRLGASCVPFRMTRGDPFVFLAILGPDSPLAASAAVAISAAHPKAKLVGMHTWFRLFVSIEDQGVDEANCDQGCGWGTGLANGAIDATLACASFGHNGRIDCMPGTESVSPVECIRNETQFQARHVAALKSDYDGSPRDWSMMAASLTTAGFA